MEPEIVYTTLTPNKVTTPVAMQNGNVLDNNNVDNNNKGKAIQLGSFSDDEQEENESSPGSSPLSSNSLLDPDSLIYEDDSDQYGYEMDMEEDQEADDYVSEYQALFDAKEKELPAGVEATSLHVRNTVLVSIQGLILNEKPYFNEPGLARTSGSPSGESRSKAYSESIFLLSLKIWFTTRGDHPSCAHDVLKACDAYRDGAPVASLVRGKVKEGESNEKCSEKFRTDVATFVDTILLKEFILLGVLGLEPGEEDKPSETKVAESSSSSRRKRGRVSLK
ncbi:hypothetical protein F2Q69_00003505 [Brassica cretica]|uniref:Uncharacterized protein n=1 Tax=Brassica cretica TaxID=69181 RepID=A0A8S9NQV4_BRACR|nr:hypothetical protein F2Q69_00003505 [Brassica cretica]